MPTGHYPRPPLEARLWAKVDKSGECWEWTAATRWGYGVIGDGSRVRLAHRVIWEMANGPVPVGLELDHICRNRKCVRPDHIEAVTHETNMRRAMPYREVIETCTHGHEYTPENTYRNPQGWRRCRTCIRRQSAEWHKGKGISA